MAVNLSGLTEPTNTEYRTKTGHRKAGLAVLGAGLAVAMVVAIIAAVQGAKASNPENAQTVGRLFSVNFAFNTVGLAVIQLGITVVLVGILVRISYRIMAVKSSLGKLIPGGVDEGAIASASIETEYGTAKVSAKAPDELPVHKMARKMWLPASVMGAMLVLAGMVTSWAWAGKVGNDGAAALDLSAWTQALQFVGVGLILSGISFLLATILGRLRAGGGEVQESLGANVRTLDMPVTGKVFMAFMAVGLMTEFVQFGFYLYTTTLNDATQVSSYFAWLGPMREVGLGMLLAGIVMALATIANALGFQFDRIRGMVAAGR